LVVDALLVDGHGQKVTCGRRSVNCQAFPASCADQLCDWGLWVKEKGSIGQKDGGLAPEEFHQQQAPANERPDKVTVGIDDEPVGFATAMIAELLDACEQGLAETRQDLRPVTMRVRRHHEITGCPPCGGQLGTVSGHNHSSGEKWEIFGRQPPFFPCAVYEMAETRPFCKANPRPGSGAIMQAPGAMDAVPTTFSSALESLRGLSWA
jgi:hypothetical protein